MPDVLTGATHSRVGIMLALHWRGHKEVGAEQRRIDWREKNCEKCET